MKTCVTLKGYKRGSTYYNLFKMNICQLYKRTFCSARTLQSLKKRFHKKSVKKIKCKVCPRAFSSYGDYFRLGKNDHNLRILPKSNEINHSNSENNSLKSLTTNTLPKNVQRNDLRNDDINEDELTVNDFGSMSEKSHYESFRKTNNSLDTKNDYEYDESTDHKRCLMEIQEFNEMVSYYKQKVQQLENENHALEVETASLSPTN